MASIRFKTIVVNHVLHPYPGYFFPAMPAFPFYNVIKEYCKSSSFDNHLPAFVAVSVLRSMSQSTFGRCGIYKCSRGTISIKTVER